MTLSALDDLHLPLDAADPFIEGVVEGAEEEEEEEEAEMGWSRRWRIAGAEESRAEEAGADESDASEEQRFPGDSLDEDFR